MLLYKAAFVASMQRQTSPCATETLISKLLRRRLSVMMALSEFSKDSGGAMTTDKRSAWSILFPAIWAFVSVEIGFHLNLWVHWPATSWRDLDLFSNRPAFAVALLAGLAFCYSESKDPVTRFWLWIPVSASLGLIAIPNEHLWGLVVPSGYPDRIEYGIGQWIYSAGIYFPVALIADYWRDRTP